MDVEVVLWMVGQGLFVFGLPLGLVWPIFALGRRGSRVGRRWGAGGCFVLGLLLTVYGTGVAADMPHFVFAGLIAVPYWLLGALNLFVAVALVVRFDDFWSWQATVVGLVLVVVLTGVGTLVGKWPWLPPPPTPGEGQVTGVVGEATLYGWRQIRVPLWRYDVVAAVPEESFPRFVALEVRDFRHGRPEPPLYNLSVTRDEALHIDGISLGLVRDATFTLDGLSADVNYWVCVGKATGFDDDRWSFDVCHMPKLEIPGQLRVARWPETPSIVPLSGG